MELPVASKTTDEVALGMRAQTLLQSDTFTATMAALKAETIHDWANCDDGMLREHKWRDLRALGRLEAKLRELADSARITERKTDAARRAATPAS